MEYGGWQSAYGGKDDNEVWSKSQATLLVAAGLVQPLVQPSPSEVN